MNINQTIEKIISSAKEAGNQTLLDDHAEMIRAKGYGEYGIPEDKNEEVLKFLCNKIKKGNYELKLPGIDLAKLLETYCDPDEEAKAKSDDDSTETIVTSEVAVEKTESLEEVLADRARITEELAVAKQMLVQYDNKVSLYESLDLDVVIDTLEKYEALGTPDELESAMKSKTEASIDTSNINLERDNMDLKTLSHEEAVAKLEAYIALGTPEEIAALMAKAESLKTELETVTEDKEKIESDLGKYTDIGTVEEVLQVVTEFSEIKMKAEAEALAAEFKLPLEKVESVLEKVDTISDARSIFESFAPAKDETTDANAVDTATIDDTTDTTVKTESATVDVEVEAKEKTEAQAESLKSLRDLCSKI